MTRNPEISIIIDGEQFTVAPTVIADAEIRFVLGERDYHLACQVVETLSPEPSIVLECPHDALTKLDRQALNLLHNTHGTEISVRIVSGKATIDADLMPSIPSGFGIDARSNPLVFHLLRHAPSAQGLRELSEVSFGLVNMTALSGFGHYVAGSRRIQAIGGTTLADDDWCIQIRESPNRNRVKRYLRSVGGFGITHIVSMTKGDGGSFSQAEALTKTISVRRFLSFANGAWVGTCRVSGVDAHWRTVWQHWQSFPAAWSDGRRNESWLWNGTEFNLRESKAMQALFPLYTRTTQTDYSIESSVERYLTANAIHPFVEFASNRTMGEMAAAVLFPAGNNPWKEFEVELKSAGLDLNIPDECPNLQLLYRRNPKWTKSKRQNHQLQPGPRALSELRGHFEHPKRPVRGLGADYAGQALFEAWHLSQWYLETIILHKCGYTADRGNRVRGGEWGPVA